MKQATPSIADVLTYVISFHEQCRHMVLDAVRLLRDSHQIYLTRNKTWDYAEKPNDRFLDQESSMVRRAWMTFLPATEPARGALFHFEFFRVHQRIEPALIFGTIDAGAAGFSAADRFASWYMTTDAEHKKSALATTHDGPVAIVTGAMPKYYEEMMLVRVPLERIVDQQALEQIVVTPLVALLKGNRAEAIEALNCISTEVWPLLLGAPELEEADSEQA